MANSIFLSPLVHGASRLTVHANGYSSTWDIDVDDALRLISPEAWRTLGIQSLRYNRTIEDILSPLAMKWDETVGPNIASAEELIRLEGILPCGLYGAILSDGSVHT